MTTGISSLKVYGCEVVKRAQFHPAAVCYLTICRCRGRISAEIASDTISKANDSRTIIQASTAPGVAANANAVRVRTLASATDV